MNKKEALKYLIEFIEKKDIIKYIIIGAICLVLISFLIILKGRPTGFAVFEGPGEGQYTLMLQIADSENLGDAYVLQGQPNGNFGSETDLITKSGGTNQKNSYLSFNISGIPENQIIDNAILCIYLYNDKINDVVISVYHVYDSFDESIVTWNNQPCGTGFGNSDNCNLTAESSLFNDGTKDNTWQCWDVKNMIGKNYYDEKENISIALHAETATTYADFFYSKEYAGDIGLRPYLNITYHTANTAPTINLVSPQDGASYGDNESLALDFSVSDADDNLDACWYFLNEGSNITLTDCQNTTIDVPEGSNTLVIYANDTEGEEASDSASFNVDVGAPTIILNFPIDEYLNYQENIEFNYTPADADLDSCKLWGDFNGSFSINQTDSSPASGFVNTFIIDFLNDSNYLWNIECNDSIGNSAINGNKTFYIDTINPSLSITNPVGTKTSRTGIPLIFSVSDNSPLTCYYNITTSVGTDVVNNVEIVNCSDTNFDVSADGDYIIYLWAADSAGNSNSASSSFSVDTSSNGGSDNGGGGSGGGGTFVGVLGKLKVLEIGSIIAYPGDKKTLSLSVKNTGAIFVNDCRLIVSGDISSWVYSDQIKGIALGEIFDFVLDLNIPDEIDSGTYSGDLEVSCAEASDIQTIEISIPPGLVEFREIVHDKDGLSINYVFDGRGIEEEVVLEIWITDDEGYEVYRTEDVFVADNDFIERQILIEIPKDLAGIYSVYFALSTDLDDFVQKSVVLGETSATGFAIFDTTGGKMAIYAIFLLLTGLAVFFIWRRHKKHVPIHKVKNKWLIGKHR